MNNMENIVDNEIEGSYFLKSTQKVPMDSSQKAILNRKGNVFLNNGDAEAARRIFITTGYSDGLARVGDFYKKQNRPLDALRMYWIAHDKKKADDIVIEAAMLIKSMLSE